MAEIDEIRRKEERIKKVKTREGIQRIINFFEKEMDIPIISIIDKVIEGRKDHPKLGCTNFEELKRGILKEIDLDSIRKEPEKIRALFTIHMADLLVWFVSPYADERLGREIEYQSFADFIKVKYPVLH